MPIDPDREFWKPGMEWAKAVEDIAYVKALADEMGGADRVQRQPSETRAEGRGLFGGRNRRQWRQCSGGRRASIV